MPALRVSWGLVQYAFLLILGGVSLVLGLLMVVVLGGVGWWLTWMVLGRWDFWFLVVRFALGARFRSCLGVAWGCCNTRFLRLWVWGCALSFVAGVLGLGLVCVWCGGVWRFG